MDKLKNFETIIIGAGASGLMSAIRYKNSNIALIEANPKIGIKIEISGGGNCNVTNKFVSSENFVGDSKFVEEILNNFSNKDLIRYLKQNFVEIIVKKNSQYFCKNSSNNLLNYFKKNLNRVELFLNTKVLDVDKIDDNFIIKTTNRNFKSKYLVVASGGVSYPKISTDIGYKIAQKFGHKIATIKPALVGFTVQKEQFWFKNLSGVSIFSQVKIKNKTFKDNILFTHKGVSGPCILNSSLYWEKGEIEINFLPNNSIEKLLKPSKKQLSTILPLPKRFLKEFLESISLEDKPINSLTKEDKNKILTLKNYRFSPAGNFGYSKAEVTKGGVSTEEIDSKTMMSKICKNLYFLGETLDVTGELGGYNLQFAFSSAFRLKIH